MKIKKNGKTINLTESDIKILSKRILKEGFTPNLEIEDLRKNYKGKKFTGIVNENDQIVLTGPWGIGALKC